MNRSEARRAGRPRWTEVRRVVRGAVRAVSPEQRRFSLLAGLLYALATALVFAWGPLPSPWHLGDRPESDVDARTGYQYPDPVARSLLQRRAAEAVPNVYRRDDSGVTALEADLERLITAARAGREFSLVARERFRRTPPTPAEYQALVEALTPEHDPGKVLAAVRKMLLDLAETGLISSKRKEAELRQQRERFTVLAGEARPPTTYQRDLVMVAEDHQAVEGVLLADTTADFGSGAAGQALRRAVAAYIARRVQPTLLYDPEATAQARRAAADAVGPVVRVIRPGQVIARRGQPITPEVLAELRREHAAWLASRPPAEPLARAAASAGIALLLAAFAGGMLWVIEPRIVRSKPRLMVFGLLCLLVAAAARFLQLEQRPVLLTPVALVVIALAIAYHRRLALGSAFLLSVLAALATDGRLETLLVFLSGAAVGALGTREVRNRARLIEVGFAVGLAQVVTVWVTGLWSASAAATLAADSLWGLAGGVMTGLVITGGLPFIEMLFKITTDISLLELSGANQPLLRRLALEAPGTYNHSLVVGSLAESAAEAVGANGLLARLGSLFHDVGKIAKPHYFVENRTEPTSRHEGLTPQMSARVIINHVKEGVEMAREHRLPRVIRDIIAEHHGTTRVEYFFQEARRQRPADEGRGAAGSPPPDDSPYRYPGPRPRSRESAIVMLADAVESATRSMSEPTPARIENLVRQIARRRMEEGQFDECGLTFQELGTIQSAMAAGLARIYHSRVRYPGQDELEGRADAEVAPAEPAARPE